MNQVSALEHRWQQVESSYLDSSAHDRFIEHCELLGRLDYAASCYNARLSRLGPDDIAEGRIQEISARAVTSLEGQAAPPPARRTFSQRYQTFELALWLSLLGFIGGTTLGVKLFGASDADTCGGLLKGSPFCLISDLFAALRVGWPLALLGALAGLFCGTWLANRFHRWF